MSPNTPAGARYWDDEYRGHVQYYDRRRLEFRRDAASAWTKLIELGCEGVLSMYRVHRTCRATYIFTHVEYVVLACSTCALCLMQGIGVCSAQAF